VFLLCFSVLVAATSAATVCKCTDKEVNKSNAFKIEYSIVIAMRFVTYSRTDLKFNLSSYAQEKLSFQKGKDFEASLQHLLPRNTM